MLLASFVQDECCVLTVCFVFINFSVPAARSLYCFGICHALWHSNILSQDGLTSLLYSVENGHTECVRLLVESGADKEAKNDVRDMLSSLDVVESIYSTFL